jgi:hypothetical protein
MTYAHPSVAEKKRGLGGISLDAEYGRLYSTHITIRVAIEWEIGSRRWPTAGRKSLVPGEIHRPRPVDSGCTPPFQSAIVPALHHSNHSVRAALSTGHGSGRAKQTQLAGAGCPAADGPSMQNKANLHGARRAKQSQFAGCGLGSGNTNRRSRMRHAKAGRAKQSQFRGCPAEVATSCAKQNQFAGPAGGGGRPHSPKSVVQGRTTYEETPDGVTISRTRRAKQSQFALAGRQSPRAAEPAAGQGC